MNTDFINDPCDDWDPNEYSTSPPPAPSPLPPAAPTPTASFAATRLADTTDDEPASRHLQAAQSPAIPNKKFPNNFPAFMTRSALFRASTSDGEFQSPTLVPAAGCTLVLTGPMLSMRDKHVWETAIQIAKERAPSVADAFEIELRDFARRMGSNNRGGRSLASIWKSLERLASAHVDFQIGQSCKGAGTLLDSASRKGSRRFLCLGQNFAIPALLGDKQFLLDQVRRSTLTTSLARWLHDYYSTHEKALEIDLKYLRGLCGYDGRARTFPSKLKNAMAELARPVQPTVPPLIASFKIVESSQSSDSWILQVVLGSVKPSFRPAQRVEAPKTNRRGKAEL